MRIDPKVPPSQIAKRFTGEGAREAVDGAWFCTEPLSASPLHLSAREKRCAASAPATASRSPSPVRPSAYGGGTWLIALLIALAPGLAFAHPIDEVVQGAYLTLSPGKVQLELDLSPGPQIAASVLTSLDANGDKRITDAEARNFATKVLKACSLTLDGKPAAWTVTRVVSPPYNNLQIGADTLKIYATARRAETKGGHSLDYLNTFQPAKSQWTANIFLQPGDGWTYQVGGLTRTPDGQGLNVRYFSAKT